MTREEAIYALEIDIHNAEVSGHQTEQYKVAIEALKSERGDDAISRQAVRHILNHEVKLPIKAWKKVFELVDDLPSVTPVRKIGRWIYLKDNAIYQWECSECKHWWETKNNYCPKCGAMMQEAEE